MCKKQLILVTNLVTGLSTFNSHMVRLRILKADTCRWCREAVEYPVLSNRRCNLHI